MTWKDAKIAGDERTQFMIARLVESGCPRGTSIRLVDYETEEDFSFLRPGDPWPYGFHKMVLRAVKRRIRAAGYHVELRTLRMSDYFDWLSSQGVENTTQNRALFIASYD